MNHRFTLPAALALALLGEIFLGFPARSALVPAVRKPKDALPDEILTLVPAEPESSGADEGQSRAITDRSRLPDIGETPVPPRPDAMVAPLRPGPPATPGMTPVTIDAGLFRPAAGGPGKADGFGPAVVDAARLNRIPQARLQSSPVYPATARTAGLTGEVVVEFVVTTDGRATNARVLRSSDPIFEEPTLRAVAKWGFEPGRAGGRPEAFRMIAPVVFRLDG
jgi:protein TonB